MERSCSLLIYVEIEFRIAVVALDFLPIASLATSLSVVSVMYRKLHSTIDSKLIEVRYLSHENLLFTIKEYENCWQPCVVAGSRFFCAVFLVSSSILSRQGRLSHGSGKSLGKPRQIRL